MFPIAAGLTSLMAGWATQARGSGFVVTAAVGIGIGLGAFVIRWFTGADRMADRAQAEFEHERDAAHQQRLKTLDHRVYRDGEARTNQALGGLRELDRRYRALRADPERRTQLENEPEIDSRLNELLELSVRGLERMADLHDTRQDLVTDQAKQKVDDARAKLLNEVEQGIDAVVRTLDGLYTLNLNHERPVQEIAELRDALDTSLVVARRVEDRMAELERDITPGGRARLAKNVYKKPLSIR